MIPNDMIPNDMIPIDDPDDDFLHELALPDIEGENIHGVMEIFEDTEAWETKDRLEDAQDWQGLVRFYETRVREAPDDLGRAIGLAEALITARELDRAIDFLQDLHRAHPSMWAVRDLLLDALYERGRRPTDVAWIVPPCVLDVEAAANLTAELVRATGDLPFYVVLERLVGRGYLWFRPGDLLDALETDSRVEVIDFGENRHWDTWIAPAEPGDGVPAPAPAPSAARTQRAAKGKKGARRKARAKARRRSAFKKARRKSRKG